MILIIMGPQGSGKTTQADMIAQSFGIPHLESGKVFREIAEQDTPIGQRVRTALSSGQLVDPQDVDFVVSQLLEKARYHDHAVIDGFPRDISQAEKYHDIISRVFYLDVGIEECIRRLTNRGREDDTPELIAERLRLYHERTVPVLNYFEQVALLERVNGETSPEEVFADLHSRILRMLQTGEVNLLS